MKTPSEMVIIETDTFHGGHYVSAHYQICVRYSFRVWLSATAVELSIGTFIDVRASSVLQSECEQYLTVLCAG